MRNNEYHINRIKNGNREGQHLPVRSLSMERLEERFLLSTVSPLTTSNSLQEADLNSSCYVSNISNEVQATNLDLSSISEENKLETANSLITAVDSNSIMVDEILYTAENIFQLNSLPGANYTIYLDFTGNTLTGSFWNTSRYSVLGSGIITTPVFSIDSSNDYNSDELAIIYEVWLRISEDYMPFQVNVTTQEPESTALYRSSSSDNIYGTRVCIGGSWDDWYVTAAGGISRINSFTMTLTRECPCFVFSKSLLNSAKYIAESATHELGHTLGLYHDGYSSQSTSTEYYEGTSTWAPIMGTGYYSNLTQWSKGEYEGAHIYGSSTVTSQDEVAILSSKLRFRTDDYADSFSDTECSIGILGNLNSETSMSGIIEQSSDIDLFSFSTSGLSAFLRIGGLEGITNLDVLVKLYDSNYNLLTIYDTEETLSIYISLEDLSGDYYFSVEGCGCGTPSETGYSDYGSLGAYSITVLPLPDLYFEKIANWPAAAYMTIGQDGLVVKTEFRQSDNIYLFFSWVNIGMAGADTDPYYISVFCDDSLWKVVSVSTNHIYGTGACKTIAITNLSIGNHTITIKLDSENSVDESNEDNNEYILSFTILPNYTDPLYVPGAISLSSWEIAYGVSAGTEIGTLSVVDPNGDSDIVYVLVDETGESNNTDFQIESNRLLLKTTLTPGTYTVSVRAINSLGCYSDTIITVIVNPSSLEQPSDFSVIDIDWYSIELSWSSVAHAGGYILYYKESTADDNIWYQYEDISQNTDIMVTGLKFETSYDFKLQVQGGEYYYDTEVFLFDQSTRIDQMPVAVLTSSNGPSLQYGTTVFLSGLMSSDEEDGSNLIYLWKLPGTDSFIEGEGIYYLNVNDYSPVNNQLEVTLRVMDQFGKYTDTTQCFQIESTTPVIVSQLEQTVMDDILFVRLSVNAFSCQNIEISQWTIDWGDGKINTIQRNSSSLVLYYIYNTTGTKNITLRLNNEKEQYSLAMVTIPETVLNVLQSDNVNACLAASEEVDFANKESDCDFIASDLSASLTEREKPLRFYEIFQEGNLIRKKAWFLDTNE